MLPQKESFVFMNFKDNKTFLTFDCTNYKNYGINLYQFFVILFEKKLGHISIALFFLFDH